MALENLKLLETKIEQFVQQHEHVGQECAELRQRVETQEKRLAQADVQLKQYEQERSQIKARLERILNQLGSLNLT
ncbi:MAG: cell division protein ZapB [Candidatus Binatia bacterium]